MAENYGKSIKIEIECDDILKLLAGLANQDRPIEITKLIARVDKNGKVIGNPYHPEDNIYLLQSTPQLETTLPSAWEIKQEIEMDLMKAEIEKKLDRENHNFIAKPAVISEDELETVSDTAQQTTKTVNKINTDTDYYLQKLKLNKRDDKDKPQEDEKQDNIAAERKKEIETVNIENNAVLVQKDIDVNKTKQKRFMLKKGDEENKSDPIRIDYSPAKTGMELSDEDKARRPADSQDFKDYQRRFILVDGPEKKNSYRKQIH